MNRLVSLFFTILLVLTITVSDAYSHNSCEGFYTGSVSFKSWILEEIVTDKALKAEDFILPYYMEKIRQTGEELVLETFNHIDESTKSSSSPLHVYFRFITSKTRHTVLEFNLQKGEKPGEMVIEDFAGNDPLKKSHEKRHGEDQGVPSDVFNHLRFAVFQLIKVGGYKKVVVLTSQNLMTYYLYRNIVGAKPINSEGEELFKYLREITRQIVRKKILGEEFKSIADLNSYLGDGEYAPPKTIMRLVWSRFKNKDLAAKTLSILGARPILDSKEQIIGFKKGNDLMFIANFLPEKPILDWYLMHLNYPEVMKLARDL